nr:tetronasin-transport integral membrane protein ABC transporter [Mycolicibacter nonchromogenicus]
MAALAGSALAMLVAGLAAGIVYGAAAGDIGRLPAVVGSAAVQLPAAWLPAAGAVALFGLAPRLAPAAWAVLTGFVALYLLGSVAGLPQWVLDLEPFAHVPVVADGTFRVGPLIVLLIIDAALITLGVQAFRRRDLMT